MLLRWVGRVGDLGGPPQGRLALPDSSLYCSHLSLVRIIIRIVCPQRHRATGSIHHPLFFVGYCPVTWRCDNCRPALECRDATTSFTDQIVSSILFLGYLSIFSYRKQGFFMPLLDRSSLGFSFGMVYNLFLWIFTSVMLRLASPFNVITLLFWRPFETVNPSLRLHHLP